MTTGLKYSTAIGRLSYCFAVRAFLRVMLIAPSARASSVFLSVVCGCAPIMAQVLAAALRFYFEAERYVNTRIQHAVGNARNSFATCTDNPFPPDIERQLLPGHRVQGACLFSASNRCTVVSSSCFSIKNDDVSTRCHLCA